MIDVKGNKYWNTHFYIAPRTVLIARKRWRNEYKRQMNEPMNSLALQEKCCEYDISSVIGIIENIERLRI